MTADETRCSLVCDDLNQKFLDQQDDRANPKSKETFSDLRQSQASSSASICRTLIEDKRLEADPGCERPEEGG